MKSSRTIALALDEATHHLTPARPKSPRLDAEILLAHVLGETRSRLYTLSYQSLGDAYYESFWELVEQRRNGVPVAYLVGWREFYSRRFSVTPDVLIPRPETETLVEESLRLIEQSGLVRPRLLDLGTGSGCVGITLALECADSVVKATDLSVQALEVAEENARRLGCQQRIKFFQGDLFAALEGRQRGFDVIVSNPPYVATDLGPRPEENVVRNEPSLALFAGRDGLDVIRRLIQEAPGWLNPGGNLAIEMASFQIEGVEALMQERGFSTTRILADLAGLPRVLVGRWEN